MKNQRKHLRKKADKQADDLPMCEAASMMEGLSMEKDESEDMAQ